MRYPLLLVLALAPRSAGAQVMTRPTLPVGRSAMPITIAAPVLPSVSLSAPSLAAPSAASALPSLPAAALPVVAKAAVALAAVAVAAPAKAQPAVREGLTTVARAVAKPAQAGSALSSFYTGSVRSQAAPFALGSYAPSLTAGLSRNGIAPAARFEYRWGMKSADLPGRTPLEKHLAFFDSTGDGTLTVAKTFGRLREMGFGFFEAGQVALGIQFGIRSLLGKNAPGGIMAALTLRVDVADAHLIGRKGTHHIFDREGNIDAEKMRRLYSRSTMGAYRDMNGRDKSGSYLTKDEMLAMVAENAQAEDPGAAGRIGNRIEWEIMFKHFADGTVTRKGVAFPVITTDSLTKLYDGRLYYEKVGDVAIERSEAAKARR
ncbi:MAG: hypothetical protein HYZ75_05600 [Elusimicrobia bacterium]|nr:hypothetical protein [Elusimicrobiota bacterium]